MSKLVLGYLRYEVATRMGAPIVAGLILAAGLYSPIAGMVAFGLALMLALMAAIWFVVLLFR